MLMKSNKTKWLVYSAALCAIAIVLVWLLRIPIIPSAPYLEYDLADVPIFIGTFLFGIPTGLMITLVVCILQGILLSAQSGIIGIIMHIIATGAFVIVCGSFVKNKNSDMTRSFALALGSITMTLIMIPLNLVFSSFFYAKVPLSIAFQETLKAFVTFPTGINSAIVIISGAIAFIVSFFIIGKTSKSKNIVIKSVLSSLVSLLFAFLVILPLNIILGSISFPEGMSNIVVPMLWTAIIPFNAIKAVANSIITFVVLAAIHRSKLITDCT